MAVALTTATLAIVLWPVLRNRRVVALVTVAVAVLAAPLLYAKLGAVRLLEEELVQDAATAADARAVDDVRDDLASHLAHNARDSRGWALLARLELAQDRFAQAASAYERALANPKAAADAALWCEYAEAMALAQGGRLAGRPREIIGRALTSNPTHPQALELAGSAAAEAGEYGLAAAYWRMLLAQLPDASRERGELGVALARIELLARADLH